MKLKTILAIALMTLVIAISPASAQTGAGKPTVIPTAFKAVLDTYKAEASWPKDNEPVYDWVYYAKRVLGNNSSILRGLTVWVFERPEASFAELVKSNESFVRMTFEGVYFSSGIQGVLNTPYTSDIHGLYGAWYACMEKNVTYTVLIWVDFHHQTYDASKEEGCKKEYKALSEMFYADLSENDIMWLGFLSRRQEAHLRNPRMVKAEFIRQTAVKLFHDD